jgi:hypothetical protein
VIGRWQGVRRADEDQARLLATTDDLDRESPAPPRPGEDHARIPGHPHRVGGHGTHGFRIEAAQAFAKTTQGLDRTLLRGMIEQLLTGQTGTEPDRFLEGLERVDLIANNSPDLQTKAVGTQVHTGD